MNRPTNRQRIGPRTLAAITGLLLLGQWSGAVAAPPAPAGELLGMYVHEGWVYNRPYAARTWTYEDWHGYLDGLHRLGFNMIAVWPMLETMPDPLTPSDKAKLDKMRRVIAATHQEFQMQVWITLCPNIMAIDRHAERLPFERRKFFGADVRVDPGNAKAMDAMMAWRESLFKPLAEMDAVVIIDSDPGGYPGSTNREFVDLLMRHRQMLDKLRPGKIELVYWSWVGWPAYGRYYATDRFAFGTEQEFMEAFTLLKERNPEPWGLAPASTSAACAQKLGLGSRSIHFNYGAIEVEPSFPMTNFTGCGAGVGPRGVVGNAQTHCLQLPNTASFARSAKRLPPMRDADYIEFANNLIVGRGEPIFAAWQALGGSDSGRMRRAAEQLAPLVRTSLEPGPLKGLLFGQPKRFISDLYIMLRLKAASVDFVAASEKQLPVIKPYAEFVGWLDRWQSVTGYESEWQWRVDAKLNASLQKLQAPSLVEFRQETEEGNTPLQRIAARNYRMETQTLRLVQALKRALWEMDPQ